MKTILIVDDDAKLRDVICATISVLFPSVRILEAENGRQAIEIAQAEIPDLILLDGNMPLMNGYETAQTLKGLPQTSHIPLIGISGSSRNNPITLGLKQMCDSWLPKPFTLDKLLAVLNTYLEGD